MIKQIGTKIYYCLLTGNIILIIGDMQGCVIETTFDKDYEAYKDLKQRDKATIGLLKFEYGEYEKLSKNSTGVIIDLQTKKPIFTYEELPIPPQEPTEIEILQNRLSNLEVQNKEFENALIELASLI